MKTISTQVIQIVQAILSGTNPNAQQRAVLRDMTVREALAQDGNNIGKDLRKAYNNVKEEVRIYER